MGTYEPKQHRHLLARSSLHVGDNISAIVNAASVGATFYFEPGIYRGVSITPKGGQTFIGAEGARQQVADLSDFESLGKANAEDEQVRISASVAQLKS